MKNKKAITPAIGIFATIAVLAVIFVVVGIILSFGAEVTEAVQRDVYTTASTTAVNISGYSLDAQSELAGWQDNWAMIIAVVVIISLLGLALGAVLMYVKNK